MLFPATDSSFPYYAPKNELGLAYGVGLDGGMVLRMFPDASIG